MSKATQDTLAMLHQRVAEKIMEKLDSEECTAQDIAQAIKFLKDNNVLADPDLNEAIMKLTDKVDVMSLPFPVTKTN